MLDDADVPAAGRTFPALAAPTMWGSAVRRGGPSVRLRPGRCETPPQRQALPHKYAIQHASVFQKPRTKPWCVTGSALKRFRIRNADRGIGMNEPLAHTVLLEHFFDVRMPNLPLDRSSEEPLGQRREPRIPEVLDRVRVGTRLTHMSGEWVGPLVASLCQASPGAHQDRRLPFALRAPAGGGRGPSEFDRGAVREPRPGVRSGVRVLCPRQSLAQRSLCVRKSRRFRPSKGWSPMESQIKAVVRINRSAGSACDAGRGQPVANPAGGDAATTLDSQTSFGA